MKKLSILPMVAVCLFSIQSAKAQLSAHIGVKGGLNVSTILNESTKYSTLNSPYAGVVLQLADYKEGFTRFMIQPELTYAIVGAKPVDGKTTLTYLNFATALQPFIGSAGFYLETGPQIGMLLSAKSNSDGVTTDIKNNLKKMDFSIFAGLGYISDGGFGINARLTKGFLSIDEYKSTNGYVSVGLSYVFGRGYIEGYE